MYGYLPPNLAVEEEVVGDSENLMIVLEFNVLFPFPLLTVPLWGVVVGFPSFVGLLFALLWLLPVFPLPFPLLLMLILLLVLLGLIWTI